MARSRILPFTLLAAVLVPGALRAQEQNSPFNLAATRDFAVTGMRTATNARFWVTNAGPMDAMLGTEALLPAQIRKGNTFFAHVTELSLWATAGRTDYARNRARVPGLANIRNATTGGHTVSVNNHINTFATDWLPVDGSLGVHHSGIRTPTSTAPCTSHAKDLIPPGMTVMANSDCPETLGVNGWQGRGNVPFSTYLQLFQQQGNAFAFDFWNVPTEGGFIGNNFQTYWHSSDFNVSNNAVYGSVIPGQSGAPSADGYPLALEWRFDAYNFKDARFSGVVFLQATVTNKSLERYGAAMDFDSLYAGFVLRPTAAMARAGFIPELGAAVFNDLRSRPDCDGARPLPERLVITNFVGTCISIDVARGFTRGAMALVVLKSPIGDLRNKLFSQPVSPFFRPAHPLTGDTITFNIGRSCGQECSSVRVVGGRAQSAWGVLSSHDADALAGDQPTSLTPNDYWFMFHPANRAAYNEGPRVDLANPRAGGGFNWCVPGQPGYPGPSWTYRTGRPDAAPTVGADTLFLDDCNQTTNQLVGMWRDTFPDGSLKLIRGSEYIGAGPFQLKAGATTSFVVALVLAIDSISIERSLRETIELYRSFYSVPQPPPTPRVVAADVIGGSILNTFVRVSLDATRMRWVDDFLLFEAQRYRNAPATTPEGRLRRFNPWLPDSLERRARDNIRRLLVYKSCNPAATTLQFTASRNITGICAVDEIRDTLNISGGPVAYEQILRPDTVTLFTDGNIVAGNNYLYAFVVETRGAEFTVIDSAATGLFTRRVTFEPVVHELPRTRSASNIAVVYVPASVQAGGGRSDIFFRDEQFGTTIDTVPGRTAFFPPAIFSWNGFSIDLLGQVDTETQIRVLWGERAFLDEFRQTGSILLDSMRVRLERARTTGYTFTGSGATVVARPVRTVTDTVVFRASATAVPFRSSKDPPDSTRIVAGAATIATRILLGPVGVVLNESTQLPLWVSNIMTGLPFTPQTYPGSGNYVPFRLSVDTTVLATAARGFRGTARYDPSGNRVGVVTFAPISLDWLSAASRPTGAGNGGQYVIEIAASEFGTPRTYRLDMGREQLEAALNQAVAARVSATTTATDAATAAAVAKHLNRPTLAADSLIAMKVPFSVRNTSFGTEVRLAMLRADKDTTYLLGISPDTLRINVPRDQWLPGDRLMFIEDVPVGSGTEPAVTFYPAVLGCTTSGVTPRCNPISGTGGDPNYGPTDPGYQIRVRYQIPNRSPRELAFTISPTRHGENIERITQAAMDSINVVPNPYIIFAGFEQQAAGGPRVMFTHLPPTGKIQIFTVAGQFVNELTWDADDLQGSGDLFFNMRTREDTEMASGLYLYVVTARDPESGRQLKKLGRFIIIR